jgi:hypothetical protein
VADTARLGHHLTAQPLLIGEPIWRLLGDRVMRACEHQGQDG